MEDLAIGELVKHVGTLGLAGTIIITFFWGAFLLFKKIATKFFDQNDKTQEYSLKMAENVNELAKNVASTNIYFKEKLQELKNIASNTSDEVSDIKDTMLKILKIVEDLQDKS